MYITITRSEYYLGIDFYKIGQILFLYKEEDNIYDSESIRVETENKAICGYVANSIGSVAKGTHSAGYIYQSILDGQKCEVCFVVQDKVIAKLI